MRALVVGLLTLVLAGCGGGAQQAQDDTPPPAAAVTEAGALDRSLEDSSAVRDAAGQASAAAPTATAGATEPAASPTSSTEKLAASMSPNEVRDLLRRHPGVLLLDVRQPEEWAPPLGHIEGARLIPLPELNARISELADYRDRAIVTVCRSGRRSEAARKVLAAAGFSNVANMSGGMIEWRRTE